MAGCGTNCQRGSEQAATLHEGGRMSSPGFYETSPVAGPYLDFSSGKRWELVHGLGATPSHDAFISFQRCPIQEPCEAGDNEVGGYTNAAGNAVIFEDVNAQSVTLRNDTCADFFLRVELRLP
jgi:hypothetical protein